MDKLPAVYGDSQARTQPHRRSAVAAQKRRHEVRVCRRPREHAGTQRRRRENGNRVGHSAALCGNMKSMLSITRFRQTRPSPKLLAQVAIHYGPTIAVAAAAAAAVAVGGRLEV